ncbi:MAG TPA: MFS transporter, partial [Candidatus Synoicihabitans sp.]|nr:MFS transporter [Candidatus Synoicihabitans sp.]
RVLTRRDILIVFAAFLLVFAAHAINAMNLPLMLTQVLGASRRDFGIVYGVGPVAELPLMLWFGHLAARGYQLGLIRIGAAVTVAYFLLLHVATAPGTCFSSRS